jgi:SAM-dependent methyltransferase
MDSFGTDTRFSGSIPELYDSYLVPMIFEPYAADLAKRVAAHRPSRVLEIAAGTGAVTRMMAHALPVDVDLVATDLSQPMLDRAMAISVVCQFGVMFFPDKVRAFSEARRVLRPGGVLLFNVWDRIEENEFAHTVTAALARLFPEDPPLFMVRTPHGYFDFKVISRDLADAGFTAAPRFETIAARSRATSARVAAIAYCQGTPVRNEIEARGAGVDNVTLASATAITERFGTGPIDGKIQAHVVVVQR